MVSWNRNTLVHRTFTLGVLLLIAGSLGASHRTQNFVVTAPTQELATEIGDLAEQYRRDLAIEWLGQELPPWRQPCPITAQVGNHLGAGGATSFMFDRQPVGRPFGWTMSIQGSRERILDSVLPHEVTHTIFATHFGRPLPRWADEGACTTVEHQAERNKQQQMLIQFLTTGRGIAFNRMFAMKEYPRDIMPLYSQGYSLARYLIAQGGKQKYIEYIGAGMDTNDWPATTQEYYGFKDLSDLQVTWLEWVRTGSQPISGPQGTLLAGHTSPAPAANTPVAPVSHTKGESHICPECKQTLPAAKQVPQPEPDVVASAPRQTDPHEQDESWYARGRDAALLRQQEQMGRESVNTLTRPQPLGRPVQQVLEPTTSIVRPAGGNQAILRGAAPATQWR